MTDRPIQTQCCVCRRIRRGARWTRPSHAETPRLTHGYCPACYHTEMARLNSQLPTMTTA